MRRSFVARAWVMAFAALLAAVAAAVLYVQQYRVHAAWTHEMDRPLPPIARGFHPPEQGPDGLTFAWTGRAVDLSFDGLDRRTAWTLSLVVMVWRPAGLPYPEVRFAVDGVERAARTVGRDFERIEVTLPERPERRGAVVSLRVAPAFSPGGGDTRELGVAVDRLTLAPSGAPAPPSGALAGFVAAASFLGAGFASCGVPALVAAAGALPLAAGQAWLGSLTLSPYLDYARQALWLALWVAVGLAVVARAVERARRRPLDGAERFVAIASAGALYLRLLVLLHPDMPIGDALFHAHRLEFVLAGRAFFTSVAPGDYAFPYPILLYVVAAPFSVLAGSSADHVVLLRVVVTVADVLAGVAIYRMMVHAWNDRLAGAAALATYHLLPLGAKTMEWGNLTNAFGQTLFVLTAALLASKRLRMESWRRVWTLTAVMTLAFMAHPSTFGILSGLAAFTWVFFRLGRRAVPALQPAERAVLLATAVACGVAVVFYYAHFLGTYRVAFIRIASEVAGTEGGSGWSRARAGLAAVPAELLRHVGWPALALAAYGVSRLRLVAPHDRLRLVLTAWGASCLVFLAVGIVTPVALRYYLAFLPVVAMLAGLAWSHVWRARPRWRIVVVVIAGWMIWVGVSVRVSPLV